MSETSRKNEAPGVSLDEKEIVAEPMDRRSLLARIGVGALGAVGSALNACIVDPNMQGATVSQPMYAQPQPQPVYGQPVYAQPAPQPQYVQPQQPQVYQTGVTDSDGGPYADPAGRGRGGARGMSTGITDNDGGPGSDPAGQGRGTWGRGNQTGLTDSDGGPYADPAGQGRGTARLGVTGITDSDGGPYADPAGHGRGHR